MGQKEPTRAESSTDARLTNGAGGCLGDDRTDGGGREESRELARRRLLVAVGAVATAGLAGCSELTQHSFEADPVVLPGDDREALWIGEMGRDSRTVSREGPADSEVEITNHAAVYSRAVGPGER